MQAFIGLRGNFPCNLKGAKNAVSPSALQSPYAGYCRDGSCSLAEDGMKYYALDRRGELVALGDHACIGDAIKSCSFRFITVMDEGCAKFWIERQSRVVAP